MRTDHRIVLAIEQALSLSRQAREALLFAHCPAVGAEVRQAIKLTESALYRQAPLANQPGGQFGRASDGVAVSSPRSGRQAMTLQEAKSIARHLGLTLRLLRSGNYSARFRRVGLACRDRLHVAAVHIVVAKVCRN